MSLVQSLFQHLLFHHHTLFILLPQSHHLSRFSPFFSNPFTLPREMKTSQWEGIGMWESCVCVHVCVCSSVSGYFTTLSSVDEREEVSSVIYSHQPTCPICVSLRRFALSHTHLPSLSYFSLPPSFAHHELPPRPLLIWLCVSDNSCCISVYPSPLQVLKRQKALKPAGSVYGLILIPNQTDRTQRRAAANCASETCKSINTITADKVGFHVFNDSS